MQANSSELLPPFLALGCPGHSVATSATWRPRCPNDLFGICLPCHTALSLGLALACALEHAGSEHRPPWRFVGNQVQVALGLRLSVAFPAPSVSSFGSHRSPVQRAGHARFTGACSLSKDTCWEAAEERGGPCSFSSPRSHALAPCARQPQKEMRWCLASWEETRALDSEWSGILGIGCQSLASSMLPARCICKQFPELRGLNSEEGPLGVLRPLERLVSRNSVGILDLPLYPVRGGAAHISCILCRL